MLVHIIKILNTNEYIKTLPSKHSEMVYFQLTQDIEDAERYMDLEELSFMDLDFIEDCYEVVFGKRVRLKIEVIQTFTRN